MQQHGAEEGRVGGWYLFPPPPDYVDELKKVCTDWQKLN